jgi:hypothetical protein
MIFNVNHKSSYAMRAVGIGSSFVFAFLFLQPSIQAGVGSLFLA